VSTYLSAELHQQLVEVNDHRCAYCQTTKANSRQPMVVDHIIPEAQGGQTAFYNLCFACRRGKEFKGPTTRRQEPLTGELVPIFHPRQHAWTDHFAWDAAGIRLIRLTPIGRATIIALNITNEFIVDARRRWVSVGWHPPAL
jgi:HNH endonuclease